MIKHKFVSGKPDGADDTLIRPSNWNDEHDIEFATVEEFLAAMLGKPLDAKGPWDSATPVALTYSATMLLDFSTFINAKVTATGNILVGATSNVKKGQTGILEITHSGGDRTFSYDTAYHSAFGGSVGLQGTSGQTEQVSYYIADNGKVIWSPLGVAS